MLVLSRQHDEKVVIPGTQTGSEIIVTIVAIHGDKVRISFEAGQRFSINREEVANAINAERAGAK